MKTHPKISKITQQFWKTPKPRSQNMKCMKNERLDAYQEKKILKNLEETFKDWDLEWNERVWERKQRVIEREIEWNENRIARGGLNRTFSNARQMRYRDRGSCRGRCREMLVNSWGIEQVSSNKESDPRTEAQLIHQVSRSYRGGKSILDWSTRYRRAVRIVTRKRLRKLNR